MQPGRAIRLTVEDGSLTLPTTPTFRMMRAMIIVPMYVPTRKNEDLRDGESEVVGPCLTTTHPTKRSSPAVLAAPEAERDTRNDE